MSDIDVSVVIVNWNTADLLVQVIDSLKATTHTTSMEIIVVDNDSHDGSQDALRSAHPDATLIQNDDNLGFAKANNIGFRAARGNAICLVNSDIIALDGVIDILYDYLRQHPDVGVVGPRTFTEDLATHQNCRRLPSLSNALGDSLWLRRTGLVAGRALPLSSYEYAHEAEVLSGCFLMVRQEALDEVGHLDEDFFFYGEDTDWGRRFHDSRWKSVFLPSARAIHLGGASTKAFPVKYYLVMEKSDLLYWRKHHQVWQRMIYVAIRLAHTLISIAAWSGIWFVSPGRRQRAATKVRGNAINALWLLTRRSLVETPGWS